MYIKSIQLVLPVNLKSRVFIFGYAIVLGIPVSIYSSKYFQLPLTSIMLPIALFAFFLHETTIEKILIFLSFIFALFFSVVFSLTNGTSFFHALLSIIWFYTPYLFFFLGSISTLSETSFRNFLGKFSIISSVTVIILFFNIILLHDGVVRHTVQNFYISGVEYGASFTGSLLGLKLYGAWGVNSLATYFAIIHCIFVTVILSNLIDNRVGKILVVSAIGMSMFLVIFSLSRGAILGLFLFYFFLFFKKINDIKFIILIIVLTVTSIAITHYNWDYIVNIMLNKFVRHSNAFYAGDYDTFLSGREAITNIMFTQISENIFIGRGFSGFGVLVEELSTSSPHNQFLGALWKMGLVAFIPYILFIYSIMKKILSTSILNNTLLFPISLIILNISIVLNLAWDNFTVPLLGGLIMYLTGCLHKISRLKNAQIKASYNFK